jgi:hypothetical protein
MAEDLMRYDILTQDALRGVMRKVLSEVAKTDLPGEHHFYITFATTAPGVRISPRLISQYPEEMTIVLQHQFEDLVVSEHALEVGLSFNKVWERLLVPFSAVRSFVDPSVNFQLHFNAAIAPGDADSAEAISGGEESPPNVVRGPGGDGAVRDLPDVVMKSGNGGEDGGDGEVVSLDAFRKKN